MKFGLTLEAASAIAPSDTVTVPSAFLHPEDALPHCAIGKSFTLGESHTIAEAQSSKFEKRFDFARPRNSSCMFDSQLLQRAAVGEIEISSAKTRL